MATKHGTALDFDFDKFAISTIKSIDELRSLGKQQSPYPVESRINAFYRLIGLPAVLNPDTKDLDKNNVGNAFYNANKSDVPLLTYKDYSLQFADREQGATSKVEPGEYNNLLHFNSKKPSNSLESRKRGKMIPLVVNGDIAIYPQANRVAIPFMDASKLDTGNGINTLKRPFIEAVIYTRLNGINTTNSQSKKAVEDDFRNYFGLPDEAAVLADSEAGINLEIATYFRRALLKVADIMADTVNSTSLVVKKMNKVYEFPENNIAEQNPSPATEQPETKGALEEQEKALQRKQTRNQLLLNLIEFQGEGSSKNATDNVLFSSLLSVITPNEEKIERDRIEIDRQKAKNSEEIKRILKKMDLFTGDFAGISAVDILIMFAALYELKLANLLGLLNEEAANNLSKVNNGMYKSIVSTRNTDVKDALELLKEKLIELYTKFDDVVMATKNTSKQSNKAGGK